MFDINQSTAWYDRSLMFSFAVFCTRRISLARTIVPIPGGKLGTRLEWHPATYSAFDHKLCLSIKG